ncbi:gamma-glutamyltranspeptidase [Catenaria anguillulae PL171]|uniref:Glutathione hydrolase n=1 Tax=Catenaria anguillulae PL171 TaxID=765915 RepID=A0A1Y2HNU6_9FUNG|nr:gamma-glutamyltranspeptidase [Catenaria anguillulae PL171]
MDYTRTPTADHDSDGRQGLLTNDPELGGQMPLPPPAAEHRFTVLRARKIRRFIAVICAASIIVVSAVALANALWPTSGGPGPQYKDPRIFKRAAVSSEVPVCSRIGKQLLEAGGSAVDAAIGTALCVGSINSFASGIGGGGFMLIRTASGPSEVVDFRETAPANISETLFKDDPLKSQRGGLAVGVPGELRGYELAHRKHGKLPWARIIEPIVALNANGFRVSATLAGKLKTHESWIMASPVWRSVFAPEGTLVTEGATVKRTAFAKTLQTVADNGAQAFYTGPIAEALVDAIRADGGVLSLLDLKEYKPIVRKPVETWYKGRKIISAGAPASGHVLLYMLNILERFSFKEGPTAVTYHRMIEAMRYGFARRSELGDPEFLNIDTRLNQILSKDEAAAARRNISDATSYPPEHYQPKYTNAPSHGTTHLSVVDESGMAVAVTTTVNLIFGSRIMEPKTGVILNDQIDDFSFHNVSNYFGLPPSPSNYMEPMKRPMSSTAPTIVEQDGQVSLVVGGSGGSRIISAVFQTIVNFLEFDWSVTRSVFSPRLHDQLFPDLTEVEEGFPTSVSRELAARNHQLKYLAVGHHESVVQAIARTASGELEAVADYRKGGEPDGY